MSEVATALGIPEKTAYARMRLAYAKLARRKPPATLFAEELELLGPLTDRRLVHLQCNAGQDSISLALRGATVTGVDISDTRPALLRPTESTVMRDPHGLRLPEPAPRFARASEMNWLFSGALGPHTAALRSRPARRA